MTDEFKDKIRDRMESSRRFLYRGNDLPDLVEEVRSGRVEGMTHDIYTGESLAPFEAGGREPVGENVEDLPWDPQNDLRVVEVPITGGVSSSLAQTHRFNGAKNTSVVLSASEVDFRPIEYSYDFYNRNPGVYAHVRSSVDGELRELQRKVPDHDLGTLTGFVKKKVLSRRPNYMAVEGYSSEGNLPGTSSNSLIAQETEYFVPEKSASISGAVEGFVTVIEPLSARVTFAEGKDMVPGDAPPADDILEEVFESYTEPIPAGHDHYLLLVDDFQDYKTTDYEGWRVSDIRSAVLNGSRIDPADVPDHFRGDGA